MSNVTLSGQSQKLLLNIEHAYFYSKHPWAMVLSSVLVISATARVVTNLLATLAIVKQKALRESKEFLLIGFLSAFDFIQGVHHFFMFTFHYGTTFTRLHCIFTIRNICHVIGQHSSMMMLMLVSVDRLLAVLKPIWYFKQNTSYIYKMIGLLLVFSFCFAVFEVCYAFRAGIDELIPYCLTTHTFLFGFELASYMGQFWLFGSGVVYIVVIFVHRNYLQTNLSTVEPSNLQHESREWREYKKQLHAVTVTMGISAMITLVMSALPYTLWGMLRKVFPTLQVYGWIMLAPVDLSTVANLFLYIKRQKEIRKALVALFKWQKLPENLKDWFAKKRTSTAKMKEQAGITGHNQTHQHC